MSEIQWANLWKPFVGIRWDRTLLTLWEFHLWAYPWLGGVLGYDAGGWWGAVGGGVGGGLMAFFVHELFFMMYAERVLGLPECDEGQAVGARPSYIPMLERWTGMVR